MEHDKLNELIKYHRVDKYFTHVNGIDNHFAHGKSHLAAAVLEKFSIDASEVLWIGDTVHDYEVAKQLNIDTALVSFGHQHKALLSGLNGAVFNSYEELVSSLRLI